MSKNYENHIKINPSQYLLWNYEKKVEFLNFRSDPKMDLCFSRYGSADPDPNQNDTKPGTGNRTRSPQSGPARRSPSSSTTSSHSPTQNFRSLTERMPYWCGSSSRPASSGRTRVGPQRSSRRIWRSWLGNTSVEFLLPIYRILFEEKIIKSVSC